MFYPAIGYREQRMASPDFEIEITSQGWIDEANAEHDLCSHGDICLLIGGHIVAPGTGDGEYGISEGALALLRTLESDHSPKRRVAELLVPHGCGLILMMSCPIGIDWSVSHHGGRVRIQDIVRYDGVSPADATSFPGLGVELSEGEYRERSPPGGQRSAS